MIINILMIGIQLTVLVINLITLLLNCIIYYKMDYERQWHSHG
jgi:hypothetical protein